MAIKFRLFLGFSVLLGAGFTSTLPANSKIILKEQVIYYDVKGRSGRELFKSMVENGPKVGRGDRNHALATTEYDYDIQNIDVELRNGRCIPIDFDIVVRVKYTYPRWRLRNGANKTTRRAWKTFNSTVVWHEKQHVKIAIELASDYEKVLRRSKFRARIDCELETLRFKWRVSLANLKHNRKQKRFDRKDLRPGGRGYAAQLQLLKAE